MLNINGSGEVMVFRNDDGKFPNYSISIGKRKKDSQEYDNGYLRLKFRKGVELENKEKINITSSFLTFDQYINKEDKKVTVWGLFALEFERLGEQPPTEESFTQVSEDCPF